MRPVIALVLIALVAVVYAQVRDHDFVNYDDRVYVVENPMLQMDFGWASLRRAFEPYESNWIPLTWISLQLGHALHGPEPAGFQLTNAALHAANAVLLFLALAGLTGATGRSGFAAALFAVHPLHVESVAWVAERKDVLSGLFFALALLAWGRYARRPGPLRYLAVATCLALGLLAKPMLVTLPFVLLLLDHWPLDRLRRQPARAVLEKLPLLAIAAASATITYAVQRDLGAMASEGDLAFPWRVANAVDAIAVYCVRSVWPSGLAAFYPHPGDALPLGRVAAAVALVGALSAGAVATARRRPYLLVGWLWFLGMLVPVLGLVQVGLQARADRYTYLPSIGLSLALTWGLAELAAGSPARRRALVSAGTVALAALAVAAFQQVSHWKDTRALFERAAAVTRDNYLAHHALASELLADGRPAEARDHFEEALRIKPRWPGAQLGLADALFAEGETDAALARYEAGLDLAPRHASGRTRYARALAGLGRHAEAIHQLRRALRTASGRDAALAHVLLARSLEATGEIAAALAQYESALALGGESAALRFTLAENALRLGRAASAVTHYRRALALDPDFAPAANNLGWLLATHPDPGVRDPQAALRVATLLADGSEDPAILDTLAASQAAAGRFEEAAATAARAAALADAHGKPALAGEIRARRVLYAAGRPYLAPPAP